MKKIITTYLSLFLLITVNSMDIEEKKIEWLLERISKSNATFIRNGDKHTAKKAKAHLLFKLSRAKNMFWFFGPKKKITLKDFIDKIASKSSSSGKAYQVILKDGRKINTKEWYEQLMRDYPELRP